MRVFGCGILPSPDRRRRFSNVNSIPNRIVNHKFRSVRTDSSLKISIKGRDSLVKSSAFDHITKNKGNNRDLVLLLLLSLRTWRDSTRLSGFLTIAEVRKFGEFNRSTYFIPENFYEHFYDIFTFYGVSTKIQPDLVLDTASLSLGLPWELLNRLLERLKNREFDRLIY